MSDLEILLCGPPEIRQNGHPKDIPRRALRAMLFYLASQGRAVSRDQLLPLFWEDESDPTARRRLTDSISRLKSSLDDPEILQVGTTQIGLDFSRVYVDQIQYQDLIQKTGRAPWQISTREPLPEHIYQLLRQAAQLWRSTRFMAGARLPSSSALDEWLTHTSQRLELQNIRVLERLANHDRMVGNLEGSLELTRLCLQYDELNEEANFRAMHLFMDLGLYQQAIDHFERLRDTMQREMHASPSARLKELFLSVRRGNTHLATAPRPAARWRLRPTVMTPFVGRRPILERFNRISNQGGIIIVTGESGQGKSRLLKEFTEQLAPAPRLMVSTCQPTEINLPFQPFIDLIRYNVDRSEIATIPAVWASYLGLLLPEIAEMRDDLEIPAFEPEEGSLSARSRASIMEAIRQMFHQFSRQQRIILCIDDLQWSDEATLATLSYLVERPPFTHNGLVLAAARLDEEYTRLDSLLYSIKQSGRGVTIPLGRMNNDEISELTLHITGQTPSLDVIQQLVRETGGNPFFLLESLHYLMEIQPGIDLTQVTTLPVTERMQNLVHARLDRLPGQIRGVFEAAAILGTDFDPIFLSELSQQPDMVVANALQELEKRELIYRAGDTAGRLQYFFSHDQVREILLETINPLKTRLLHQTAARILVGASNRDDQAALIADHYEKAGELGQAVTYWIRALRYARSLYAGVDAHWIFRRAEALIQVSERIGDEQIAALYNERSEMAYEVEDAATIQRIHTDLLRLGRQRGSKLLIGQALDGLGEACMVSNQFEDGLAYTNEAIPYLETGESSFTLMQAYNHRGTFLYLLNRVHESLDAFQDALTIGLESQDSKVLQARGNAHYQIAITNVMHGHPETAAAHAQRSLAEYSRSGHNHGQITAYSALALSNYFQGNYGIARRHCQHGLDMARRGHAWRMMGYLHVYMGMIDLATGSVDEGIDHARQAINLGDRYHHTEISAGGHRLLGDAFNYLSAAGRAIPHYQSGVEASQENFLAMDSAFRLVASTSMIGRDFGSTKGLEDFISQIQSSGMTIFALMARIMLLNIHYLKKDWKAVQVVGEDLLTDARQASFKSVQLITSNIFAEMEIEKGSIGVALEMARKAALEALEMPHPWFEIQARVLIIRILNKLNQTEPGQLNRVTGLLGNIQSHITQAEYLAAFQLYRDDILSRLGT